MARFSSGDIEVVPAIVRLLTARRRRLHGRSSAAKSYVSEVSSSGQALSSDTHSPVFFLLLQGLVVVVTPRRGILSSVDGR